MVVLQTCSVTNPLNDDEADRGAAAGGSDMHMVQKSAAGGNPEVGSSTQMSAIEVAVAHHVGVVFKHHSEFLVDRLRLPGTSPWDARTRRRGAVATARTVSLRCSDDCEARHKQLVCRRC